MEIYDYGRTADGTFFYVMEYLHGLSLDELVGHHGPLPPRRAIYLLRQACEALAESHAAGLIHRDLKPGNIFAARRGRRYDFVKLLDFGLVEAVAAPHGSGLSHEGTVRGTPQYMAPEQITGDRAVDRRCDLYAMGGVAYTLLTGRPPFEGETAAQVMSAHVHDPVVPPSRHRPDIPTDLEKVVLRCLAKDPNGRFQSAEELETVLAACTSAAGWDAKKAASWWEEFEPPTRLPGRWDENPPIVEDHDDGSPGRCRPDCRRGEVTRPRDTEPAAGRLLRLYGLRGSHCPPTSMDRRNPQRQGNHEPCGQRDEIDIILTNEPEELIGRHRLQGQGEPETFKASRSMGRSASVSLIRPIGSTFIHRAFVRSLSKRSPMR